MHLARMHETRLDSTAFVDQELDKAERILSQAKRLLEPKTLIPFLEIPDDPNEDKHFRGFLANLHK